MARPLLVAPALLVLSQLAIPQPIEDLSLVEVPAAVDSRRDDFAVIMTGDGGWARLDKAIAKGLADAGIPVVGWSSLSYYWTPRTPDGAAADLARIIEHYSQSWQKNRVLLIGYSFGADVMPFLVNRLSSDLRRRVAGVVLLSPSSHATFEFHVIDWLRNRSDARYPIAPEINQLTLPVTCVYATDQADSVCVSSTAKTHAEAVGRGHHFSGEYARLVQLILQ